MKPAWPLVGHTSAERSFLDAYRTGHLHHGWLIEGPQGIGKARLAKRFAALLLGARGPESSILDAYEHDPIVQAVESEGHPDLCSIARKPDDKGKLPQDIAVSAIRDLTRFFSLKPALGGWRVAIVDSLDELNLFGANALLKTLEEPPPNSVLFLIAHGKKPILPTLRSRCRRLRLSSLSEKETTAVLNTADNVHGAVEASQIAPGRPGHALTLSTAPALRAAQCVGDLAATSPKTRPQVLAEAVRRAGADLDALEAFFLMSLRRLSERAQDHPDAADDYLKLCALMGEVRELSMAPGQAAAKAVSHLQKAFRPR